MTDELQPYNQPHCTQWLERMYLFSHANDGSRRGGMGHGLVDRFLGGMAGGEPATSAQLCSYTRLQYQNYARCKASAHLQNHFTTWKMASIFEKIQGHLWLFLFYDPSTLQQPICKFE